MQVQFFYTHQNTIILYSPKEFIKMQLLYIHQKIYIRQNGSRKIAPEENCPTPNTNSNPNPKPNPNTDRGQLSGHGQNKFIKMRSFTLK